MRAGRPARRPAPTMAQMTTVRKLASMTQRVVDESCAEFAERLAAKLPVPGGGSVAAYAGALSSALCSMTAVFTVGKPRYAESERDLERILGEAERVRLRLLELVDEDARALEPLTRAYALPRTDPERAGELERATKDACAAPMEVMELVARTVDLVDEAQRKCSRLLVSDAGVAALLARAALEAASLNVFVNTAGLADRSWAEAAEARADELLATYVPMAEAVEARVMRRVRGEE
jgi:formiminotetrahydrofolate cyclodeaminase